MASGDPVVQVLQVMPLIATAAYPAIRAGGSTPAERVRAWNFVDASATYLDFLCRLKGYANGGLTFYLPWMALTATSGAVNWGIAIRRIADDAEDLDASHTFDFNYTSDTTATAAGEVAYATRTFTDGADMDSWVDGELAIVRVVRDGAGASGTDSMTDTAQLLALYGKET